MPENLAQSSLKNRKPTEENEANKAAREEAEERAYLEQPITDSIKHLSTFQGLVILDDIATEVECPLSLYQGTKVYFHTSNPTSILMRKPLLLYSPEVRAMQDRTQAMLKEISEHPGTRLPEEYWEIKSQLDEQTETEYEAFRQKKALWFSQFVRRIEPWNYGRATEWNDKGEVTRAEPLPPPNPSKPESFVVLTSEHQLLGDWCETEGYNEALRRSVRPFSSGSTKPSPANGSNN